MFSEEYLRRHHENEFGVLQPIFELGIISLITRYLDVEIYDSSIPAKKYETISKKAQFGDLIRKYDSVYHWIRNNNDDDQKKEKVFEVNYDDGYRQCFYIPHQISRHYKDILTKYKTIRKQNQIVFTMRSDDKFIRKKVGLIPSDWKFTYGFHYVGVQFSLDGIYHPIHENVFTKEKIWNLYQCEGKQRSNFTVKISCILQHAYYDEMDQVQWIKSKKRKNDVPHSWTWIFTCENKQLKNGQTIFSECYFYSCLKEEEEDFKTRVKQHYLSSPEFTKQEMVHVKRCHPTYSIRLESLLDKSSLMFTYWVDS